MLSWIVIVWLFDHGIHSVLCQPFVFSITIFTKSLTIIFYKQKYIISVENLIFLCWQLSLLTEGLCSCLPPVHLVWCIRFSVLYYLFKDMTQVRYVHSYNDIAWCSDFEDDDWKFLHSIQWWFGSNTKK